MPECLTLYVFFALSTGESNISGMFSTLAAGGYTYTVTDVNGCTAMGAFEVDDPNPLELTVTNVSDALCEGEASGTASVEATGGTGPFTFAWSGGNPAVSTLGCKYRSIGAWRTRGHPVQPRWKARRNDLG